MILLRSDQEGSPQLKIVHIEMNECFGVIGRLWTMFFFHLRIRMSELGVGCFTELTTNKMLNVCTFVYICLHAALMCFFFLFSSQQCLCQKDGRKPNLLDFYFIRLSSIQFRDISRK